MYPIVKEKLIRPYWSRDFLRKDPHNEDVEYDVNYLLNQAEAHNFFYNWYKRSENSSFIEMLKNQHLIACLGEKTNRSYKIKGYFRSLNNGNNNWDERDSFPGKLRIDLIKENISHPATDMLRVSKNENSFIENEEYFNVLYCSINNKLDFKKTKINHGPFNINTKIESLGKQRTRNIKFYKNGYFSIKHPLKEEYLICMENVTAIISELIKLKQKSNHDVLINLLAEYYHNAINWMPFAHVNNSLFMGQINVLLRHNNLKSIPHSKLDVYALLTSTNNFKDIFKEHIISYQ